MTTVIINADDLGKDEVTNSAIFDALSKGVITSSTIMANTVHWQQIHQIVENFPTASFGIHLNLTEGRALTHSEVLFNCGIVDNRNIFTKAIQSICNFKEDLLDAIYNELDAQINKIVVEEHIKVTHIDGHHHVHSIYALKDVILRLANKYGITIIRNRYNLPKYQSYIRRTLSMALNVCAYYVGIPKTRVLILGEILERKKWTCFMEKRMYLTNYFTSYDSFIDFLRKGNKINNKTIELMCHPGHKEFSSEYQLILNKSINNYLTDYKLVSYKQINIT